MPAANAIRAISSTVLREERPGRGNRACLGEADRERERNEEGKKRVRESETQYEASTARRGERSTREFVMGNCRDSIGRGRLFLGKQLLAWLNLICGDVGSVADRRDTDRDT